MVFCFIGKSGIEHCITIEDPPLEEVIAHIYGRTGAPAPPVAEEVGAV